MRLKLAFLAASILGLMNAASAFAIDDEIQVYLDDINDRGQFGLETHINTTPSGRSTPDYPGEVTPYHSWRLTPEFSYGLGHGLEAGMYIPTAIDPDGTFYAGSFKLRLKWVPVKPKEGEAGWFLGGNTEWAKLKPSYSESEYETELRIIIGYHGRDWLLAMNPILTWALSPGYRGGGPDTMYGWKAGYDVVEGVMVGLEYYQGVGQLSDTLPPSQQDRTLYLVTDVERGPISFNFGIGRGLTDATDRWTVKGIVEFPFN